MDMSLYLFVVFILLSNVLLVFISYMSYTFLVIFIPRLEKEIATHSSTLAWKIPWTEEPGMLQSMGSQRVGHD